VNGAHDMGGVHGFGAVRPEAEEPVFHADWERRVLALTLAMGATGQWSIDASRFAREDRPPEEYLRSSYYELWLAGLERLVQERALTGVRPLRASEVALTLRRGGPTGRPATAAARFAVGDRVRAVNRHPRGHTRLPRYARGRTGTVTQVHGVHVFPDSNAHGTGEDPQWLYTVCFEGRELWGEDADPALRVSVDAFEPYLEAPR
jgi:nitrile hydratase subunit beta